MLTETYDGRGRALSFAALALGGGTGHLLRAIAFARAASARGHDTRILASAPRTEDVARALAPPRARVETCTGDADEMRARARRWLAERADDALVVDCFPRGLLGELDGVRPARLRLLVHRDLADAYALRHETRAAAASFDVVVAPGEDGPLAEPLGALRTAPWIVAASVPRASRRAARIAFDVEGDDARPLVVVAVTGDDADARALSDVARSLTVTEGSRVHVRLARLGHPGAPLPLAALLDGVDLLVGAGGYHLVHEARATATPLVALASPRTYDVQARRLRGDERARDVDDVVARIRAATPRTTTPPPSIADGAAQAVEMLEERLSGVGRRPSR